MPAKKKPARRIRRGEHGGYVDTETGEETEKAPPPTIVESDKRPEMHVPGTGTDIAIQVGPQAVDMTDYTGSYHKKDEPEDAEPYGLKIDESDPYGHTHHAQNQDHHWSGTKDQFELQFVEV